MKSAQFKLHADIENKHWWFLGRRRIIQELLRLTVPASKAVAVVDVGCGTGGNLAALAQTYTCVGIDQSAEAIKFAMDRFPSVRFITGSAPAALAEVIGQASTVLLLDVLEHVSDDFALFSELLAVTKPGGHILLTVPATMSLWSEHDVSVGHHRRYDAERLAMVWSGLPVTPRLLSYYNARLYPVVRAMRILSRWRGRPWGTAGTDFSIPPGPVNRMLEQILASEAKVLVDVLQGKRARGFSAGVSLIALLRRETGDVVPRKKGPDVPPDDYALQRRYER